MTTHRKPAFTSDSPSAPRSGVVGFAPRSSRVDEPMGWRFARGAVGAFGLPGERISLGDLKEAVSFIDAFIQDLDDATDEDSVPPELLHRSHLSLVRGISALERAFPTAPNVAEVVVVSVNEAMVAERALWKSNRHWTRYGAAELHALGARCSFHKITPRVLHLATENARPDLLAALERAVRPGGRSRGALAGASWQNGWNAARFSSRRLKRSLGRPAYRSTRPRSPLSSRASISARHAGSGTSEK